MLSRRPQSKAKFHGTCCSLLRAKCFRCRTIYQTAYQTLSHGATNWDLKELQPSLFASIRQYDCCSGGRKAKRLKDHQSSQNSSRCSFAHMFFRQHQGLNCPDDSGPPHSHYCWYPQGLRVCVTLDFATSISVQFGNQGPPIQSVTRSLRLTSPWFAPAQRLAIVMS